MQGKAYENWDSISLTDLFYAYRKAKADSFFEHSLCVAERFAVFESDLANQLSELHERLVNGEVLPLLLENLGSPRVVAKKLGAMPKPEQRDPSHGFFSDPKQAFDHLLSTHDLTPEFRVIGDFPVEMHVLSALWINLVGHKFDASLSQHAYGARLRRYRPTEDSDADEVGEYHLEANGSFQPYFQPYKSWRANGLNAIRRELKEDNSVIAISLDLVSYFHNIDPSFLSNSAFQERVGVSLNRWEQEFTESFVKALRQWSTNAVSEMESFGLPGLEKANGGIPIGLSISRVMSNVLLRELDKDIVENLSPVYYGRYVDDLFLVLRDPGTIKSSSQMQEFLGTRCRFFPRRYVKKEIRLSLPREYVGKTTLVLQQAKQKLFFLQGQAGLDLLDNIESQIRSVSSERRLLPSPDSLESMASAKVLTAAGHSSEEVDALRRADGLSIRRLGWSIQLRAVEILARDLDPSDWKEERKKFYQFARNHVLRPDKILDHSDYLPRLLSLAVALQDWADARRLVDTTFAAIERLKKATNRKVLKVNGNESATSSGQVWSRFKEHTREVCRETILRSLRWNPKTGEPRRIPETAKRLFDFIELFGEPEATFKRALLLRETDWAKTAYKDHIRRDASRQRQMVENEGTLWDCYTHAIDLIDFLKATSFGEKGKSGTRVRAKCLQKEGEQTPSLLPFLCPTRPYSAQEIALFLPEVCVFGSPKITASHWARFVRAVRGIWVWENFAQEETTSPNTESTTDKDQATATIGCCEPTPKVRLGISSLLTTNETWKATASGRSDISRERYDRISTIVNQAITAVPKPTHLLLPELALPERWIDSISAQLMDSGISFIAGVDYTHQAGSQVFSEAVLVLRDDRLGFPSHVQIRQPKCLPAPGEERDLKRDFGKEWAPVSAEKPVYRHFGFCFGVLVCSELQNMDYRRRFQGNVDSLMVLSWNQDLETFSSLVEGASLDVHAYVALVNNRPYGDSRVRLPAKKQHKRDVCRIRGGENEYLVVVDIDPFPLREFQSRAKRWPDENDPFKPVPEGFLIAEYRKTIPS